MANNERKRESRNSILRDQLTTVSDLIDFKNDIITEVKKLLEAQTNKPVKRWLKSFEVQKILKISTGTLHNLRVNGTIPFSKIGGVVFYDLEDLQRILESHKTVDSRYSVGGEAV